MPATFERQVEKVSAGLHRETYFVYPDDIIVSVCGKSVYGMVKNLDKVSAIIYRKLV